MGILVNDFVNKRQIALFLLMSWLDKKKVVIFVVKFFYKSRVKNDICYVGTKVYYILCYPTNYRG